MDEQQFSFSEDVIAAVDNGRKIEAIKLLREETGLGLADAKHAIDALARERRNDSAIGANMTEEGGAGGMIKMIVVIAIMLGAYYYFFAN